MTTQQLHDALTLLPEDLILEADRRRNARRTIPFKRYAAMAAMFVLVLGCAALVRSLGSNKGAVEMAAAEAPAAIYREDSLMEVEEAAPEECPAEAAGDSALADNATITMARARMKLTAPDGERFLSEAETDTLLTLLRALPYDPARVCNCLGEYVLEFCGETWEINLTEGYARSALGQALLPDAQKQTLQEILAEPGK